MRTYYTPEKLKFIEDNQDNLSRKELANEFNLKFDDNKTEAGMRAICAKNKWITKRENNTGCFKKGFKPWNKGIKNSTGFSSTRFKKGDIPKNSLPLGAEWADPRDGCINVKIGLNEWKIKSHIEWEKHNDKLKDGEIIAYLDADRANCEYINLRKMTRRELLWLNRQKLSDLSAIEKNIMISCAKLNNIDVE